MAVITISRQVAALGDEVAAALAERLGYKFINRKIVEKKLIDLGFSESKLKKYDERKPGFFASLAKDHDEYMNYLQTAMLDAASEGDCVLIGRGSFIILEELPNRFAVRLVSSNQVRLERLMKEFNWDEKQAQQRIDESDANRLGFHKSFFNLVSEDPAYYHMTVNTSFMDIDAAVDTIATSMKKCITAEQEKLGEEKLKDLIAAQKLVNILIFEHKLPVNFLHAVINGDTVTLQGVADSVAVAEQAVTVAQKVMSGKKIVSSISIVQDFKSYP